MFLHTEKDGKDAVSILCGYPCDELLKCSDGNALRTLQTDLPGASVRRSHPCGCEEAWSGLSSRVVASLFVCPWNAVPCIDLNCPFTEWFIISLKPHPTFPLLTFPSLHRTGFCSPPPTVILCSLSHAITSRFSKRLRNSTERTFAGTREDDTSLCSFAAMVG